MGVVLGIRTWPGPDGPAPAAGEPDGGRIVAFRAGIRLPAPFVAALTVAVVAALTSVGAPEQVKLSATASQSPVSEPPVSGAPVLEPVVALDALPTAGEENPGVVAAEDPMVPTLPGPELGTGPNDDQPSGEYLIAPGTDDVPGAGRVVRYLVETEGGLSFSPAEFAGDVHGILNAPGGWGSGGRTIRFVRVDAGPVDFRVSLSSPDLTDRACAPLQTLRQVSCFNGHRAVINAERWRYGAATYAADLVGYRIYVINHEIGHALGHGHEGCPVPAGPAPVMVQQTKSLDGCAANPWPHPGPVFDDRD